MTAPSRPSPPDALTRVDLVWRPGQVEHWIRFGAVVEERIHDRRRRTVAFAPGSVFAFVRWAANEFGTVVSRLDIVAAPALGAPYVTLPHVRPGGESLLRLTGWPKVERGLQAIDAVEAVGLSPVAVAPDHWRHVHNRLAANLTPRPYTLARHRAWRLRVRAAP